MSITRKCDWCEERILDSDPFVTINCQGSQPRVPEGDPWPVYGSVGHYHSDWRDGRIPCVAYIRGMIRSFTGAGSEDFLESIPVASHQKIAAIRRTYTKEGRR